MKYEFNPKCVCVCLHGMYYVMIAEWFSYTHCMSVSSLKVLRGEVTACSVSARSNVHNWCGCMCVWLCVCVCALCLIHKKVSTIIVLEKNLHHPVKSPWNGVFSASHGSFILKNVCSVQWPDRKCPQLQEKTSVNKTTLRCQIVSDLLPFVKSRLLLLEPTLPPSVSN